MKAEEKKVENPAANGEASRDIPNLYWWIGCVLITVIAIFLRVYWIDLKPLHHDEGVNGFFLTTLFREGVYKYDPGNYHGPTLYFIALAFTKILGLETFAIRYSIAIFGVGIVLLTFALRRYLGSIGALSAGLFLALSPGMVFVSRYFIHEILFVFFTFAMVVAVVYFMEKPAAGIWANVLMAILLLVCLMPIPIYMPQLVGLVLPSSLGDMQGTVGTIIKSAFFFLEAVIVFGIMFWLSRWRDGKPIYLLLAAASCALIFATKETAFISLGTMAIGCFCIWVYRQLFIDHKRLERTWPEPVELTPKTFLQNMGDNADAILLSSAAFFIFIYVWILFFSSFFDFATRVEVPYAKDKVPYAFEGVRRSLAAYYFWAETGIKEHDKTPWKYIEWMGLLEAPIFAIGALGSLIAFWIAQHRLAMFAALWAFGLFAAYSLIPYKTPWLALSFILPVCLLAGYAINELAISRDKWQKVLAGVFTVGAVGVLTYQTVELNFYSYDNEARPYVYAQSKREYLDLFKKIEEFGEKTKEGNNIKIAVASPEYWPMPWYTRNYPNIVFHGKAVPANMVDLIITSEQQENNCMGYDKAPNVDCEQLSHYKDSYELAGTYAMRPGVDLKLYVRNDIVGKPLYNPKPPEEVEDPVVVTGDEDTAEETPK